MSDLISREAVLEKAINVPIAKVVTEDKVICRKIVFVDDIQKLPSVIPQPKIGHWIIHSDDLFPSESTQECSECHEHQPLYWRCSNNYCPNCGVKMVESQESEDKEVSE